MPEFMGQDGAGIEILSRSLSRFSLGKVHRRRSIDIYKKPLLLVHESPPTSSARIGVFVSSHDVRFSESYYGYSSCLHSNPEKLIHYLALIIGSRLSLWLALMLSGEFGFERETVEKLIIDSLPILPFERLSSAQCQEVERLFAKVAKGPSPDDWAEVDLWGGELYGLRPRDLQVIVDTLAYNLPFSTNREEARKRAGDGQVQIFCRELARELAVWDQSVVVSPMRTPLSSPWRILRVNFGETEQQNNELAQHILAMADSLAATEVVMPLTDQRGLLLARLDQARYWSVSQARLAARRLVWEHEAILGEGASR